MKMIVLAAGKGSRLRPLTENRPKPLVELVDGKSILERQVDFMSDIDEIDEMVIVAGYRAEMIEEKIDEMGYSDFVELVYNPFYDESDNFHSFWLGLMNVEGDFAVTNGDNLFNRSLLEDVFSGEEEEGIYLTIDRKNEYTSDDMKVSMNNGRVTEVSKEIPADDISAESIGLGKVIGDKNVQLAKLIVQDLIRQDETKGKYWLELYNELLRREEEVDTVEVDEDEWFEMDTHADKEIIDTAITSEEFFQ